jgi:hypothetical protein
MTLLQIWPTNERVLALTLDALADSNGGKPTTTFRCHSGGCRVGLAGLPPSARPWPLFTAAGWDVEDPLPFELTIHDRPATRRESIAHDRETFELVSGPPVSYTGRHGTIALLALPPEVPQEFPDLLVRCLHGDAVLDRMEVISLLRRRVKVHKVRVSFPRRKYAPLPGGVTHPAFPARRVETKRRQRDLTALPADEVMRRLGWDDTPR